MKPVKLLSSFIVAMLIASSAPAANGGGETSGLVLLRNSGARSSALGDAFVSMSDDITAMEFNPASLATLDSGQASLQYERGFFGDALGKAMVGMRGGKSGAFGLSVGFYNSGKADLFDGVNAQRSAVAEQDRMVNLGYGFQREKWSWGAGIKYLSSELAESYSGSAGVADAGLQYQLTPRFRAGASGPLFRAKIKYGNTSEDLPSIYRAGIGWNGKLGLATGDLPIRLLFDVPYDATTQNAALALGAETVVGVLALRMGLNTLSDAQQFSMGAGFQFRRMSLDYSFGLVDNGNLESVHKATFSCRFGDSRSDPRPAIASAAPNGAAGKGDRTLFEVKQDSVGSFFKAITPANETMSYRIYRVKSGEDLESIAMDVYGSAAGWTAIYEMNRHMYSSPDQIKSGSQILLPVKINR